MWAGCANGLYAIDANTKKIVTNVANKDFGDFNITCLYPDTKGGIWAGTKQGLVHFNPTNKEFKKYTQANGLSNDYVVGIQPEGDSCLWLSTNKGLSRFSIATEQFINFYKDDGLPDNEFNRASSFRASDGRLYFGGLKGITVFDPKAVMKNYKHRQVAGKLLLHSVSMTDDKRDSILTNFFFPDEPKLDIFYQNKTITLDFGLLDFQNQGTTQYSYLLDGHNDAWSNPSPNNTVTFSSLPSGEYTFRVKALNHKGQWVPDELAVRLVVHPPFWATWWAYLLYALALAGVAYAIFSFLKKRWELNTQLENEHREALRLNGLQGCGTFLQNLPSHFRVFTECNQQVVGFQLFTLGKLSSRMNLQIGRPHHFT